MRRSMTFIASLIAMLCAGACSPSSGSVFREPRDAKVCGVHHLPLETRKVAISYGLPPAPGKGDPTTEQTARLFPHRTRSVEGGYMIGPEKSATLKVCKGCDAAHVEWLAKHR
ncbi:hypothetical protein OVA24_12715 [Luteolibacter sp. SL250]|uniref:hypothetical protein n=1 Tax=Luteolibacter sp. SL250 TaxID=2995170 RepID=UPI00226FEA1C|nr:hypothetical protein [Luteolibacter sp. SL250]WAC18100.1 hypothetical protein OVA24_12715 [Luteolibacter sp. SL250]